MASEFETDITAAVGWLGKQQSTTGGFVCLASSRADDFSEYEEHPTIFFTALILECLGDVPGSSKLQTSAARYLRQHMSPDCTWNYWERDSSFARRQPYPDDLDDTACTLSSLIHHKPALATGKLQARVAQSLIATEQSPGGPYNTWLIDATRYPVWHDVDLAVNANVAFMLSLLDVSLPPLQVYLSEHIKANNYHSTYYVGEAPVLYFLARGYRGSNSAQLKRKVDQLLRQAIAGDNPLELALLLASGQRLGVAYNLLVKAAHRLLALRNGEHWEAFALYYEPPVKGVTYYAGSAALTSAFCVEALSSLKPPVKAAPLKLSSAYKPKLIVPRLQKMPELQAEHADLLAKLVANDPDHQITDIAGLTVRAFDGKLPNHLTALLNSASTYGWMAYTLYDDIMDGDSDASLLPLAHVAQRQMLASFREAQPDRAFQTHVAEVLLKADEANLWEARHCRLDVTQQQITEEDIPTFDKLHHLADRSMGHSLAPSAVILALGHGLQSPRQKAQRSFYRHYLTARQLVDDAHDWETDLQAGHLTAANSLVLSTYLSEKGHDSFDRQQPAAWRDLRILFWQHTILDISNQVEHHLYAAQASLVKCRFASPQDHQAWLDRLQQAIAEARQQRAQTRAFLRTFS